MNSLRLTCVFLLLIVPAAGSWLSAGEQDIPPALRTAILASYPADLFCWEESERQNGHEIPPIDEHFARGWIQVLLRGGPQFGGQIAVVTYLPASSADPDADVLVFRENGDNWTRVQILGHPEALIGAGSRGQDIAFEDVDGDGTAEIVMRYHRPFTTMPGDPGDIVVWKIDAEGLRPLTGVTVNAVSASYRVSDGYADPFPESEPAQCSGRVTTIFPDESTWSSCTGIWLKDLDGDGKLELILGPDQDRLPDPDLPPGEGAEFWQDVTGTRVYALRDGVYRKVGETQVWQQLEPEVAAALNPASIPQEELLLAGERVQGAGSGKVTRAQDVRAGTVTLYCIAPDGYDPKAVVWSSLKVTGSDPAIRPVDGGVDHPAPYDALVTPKGWLPTVHAQQLVYLEMARETRPDDFSMTDDDPVIMMGPGGRLHFSSPYRILRLDRQAVLGWLAERWRAGRADHELKSCFTKDGREQCYTPIWLPFSVRLNVSLGPYPIVAHGVAPLWVRN